MGMGFRDYGAAGCLVFSHSRDLDVSFSTCKAFCLSACSNLVYILNLGLWVIWTLRHLDI